MLVIKLGATPAAAAGECDHDDVYPLLVCGQPDVLLARVLTRGAAMKLSRSAKAEFCLRGSPGDLSGAVATAGPTPELDENTLC